MPQIRFTPAALRDLERLREFLRPKSPAVAKKVATVIIQSLQVLKDHPHIGRPIEDLPDEFREWPINFGNSGYVARYRFDGSEYVTILALRHQKEVGF